MIDTHEASSTECDHPSSSSSIKRGGSEPIVSSGHSIFHLRSVNAEVTLDEGEYVVHVRVDSEIVRDKVGLVSFQSREGVALIFPVMTGLSCQQHS